MGRLNIEKLFSEEVSLLTEVSNPSKIEELKDELRIAEINMETYLSANAERKKEILGRFNFAMAKYFAKCAAAFQLSRDEKARDLYLYLARQINDATENPSS